MQTKNGISWALLFSHKQIFFKFYLQEQYTQKYLTDSGCRDKANCSHVGPGFIREIPFVEVFLRDASPYLLEFQRKRHKTQNNQVDKRDRLSNSSPPVFHFERRRTQPLVRPMLFCPRYLNSAYFSYQWNCTNVFFFFVIFF